MTKNQTSRKVSTIDYLYASSRGKVIVLLFKEKSERIVLLLLHDLQRPIAPAVRYYVLYTRSMH